MTVAKTCVLVLDCAEPERLAEFYASLLGADVEAGGDPDFVVLTGGSGTVLAIRRDHGYAPPSWPRPDDAQQAHVRVLVAPEDLDEAEREAVALGARPVAAVTQPFVPGAREDRRHEERTFADPAGHSFTLAPAAPDEGVR
ncbi:VOC family protein [Streptomyces sp. NPDC053755]|uniref:VOC family protein n=1 Tax=Streptomyces sp. NPDC053755 TaxID=3155815 RepID=UPI003413FB8B